MLAPQKETLILLQGFDIIEQRQQAAAVEVGLLSRVNVKAVASVTACQFAVSVSPPIFPAVKLCQS